MHKKTFEELFAPQIKPLFKVAYQWTLNSQDAEDLVQELALRVVDRVDEMNAIEKLRPWLVKIMYRLFVDEIRKKNARPLAYEHLVDEEVMKNLFVDSGSDPEAIVAIDQLGRELIANLKQLEHEQAVTLFLFEVEGYSLKEIADIQSVSEGTVKSRLHRGRKIMKKQLDTGTLLSLDPC
ncbi:RNA polymerase sigma factor [Pleionea sediminis]|uniref:RNA polymerase sigma factor n=1 Tax=Pleionea sediminis TaxID=2569479 RepID=UPI0011864381|nr:RNA polymerase sigma factor [Pleionea sediminis]